MCPGFVSTNILPQDGLLRIVLDLFAFTIDEGMAVFKLALSSKDLAGGEHLVNMKFFPFSYLPRSIFDATLTAVFSSGTVFKLLFIGVYAGSILLTQRATYEPHVGWSSRESMNETLAAQLFDWSRNELVKQGYL